MSKTLHFKLLGTPAIFLGEEEIFFSFSKINALLYYLLIQKKANRDEIAGILWENKDTQTAKKNLRNTIYQANKLLGDDYIICPQRTVLTLNPDFKITSDVTTFLAQPDVNLSLYQGIFLKNFYLKHAESYDFWLEKNRAHLEQIYIKTCHQKIQQQLDAQDAEETEQHILRLIEIDEFEENNYKLLMQLYQTTQQSSKVIDTYHKLANLLEKELGISPSPDIQQIYDEVVAKDRNERKIKQFLRTGTHFFGRTKEITQLEAYFSEVLRENDFKVLTLVGGSGVGKRTVTREVLANQTLQYQIVTTECFREERALLLQTWKNLLNGLGDLVVHHQIMSIKQWETLSQTQLRQLLANPQSPVQQHQFITWITDLLTHISQKKALVLLIEDAHWMDMDSITLLQLITNHLKDCPIALVLTKHLHDTPQLTPFFDRLTLKDQLTFIELKDLDEAQSQAFFEALVGQTHVSEALMKNIYQTSQGNPFLLAEYAKQLIQGEKFSPLTPAIRAKMALKLTDLNSREEELLNYLACFKHAVAIDFIAQLLVLSYEATVNICYKLQQQNILTQHDLNGQLQIAFKQVILKTYCYDRLPIGKKRIYHGHIAQQLEADWEGQKERAERLAQIAYHYGEAKQVIKSLDFNLQHLNVSLQFQELFPIYAPENRLNRVSQHIDVASVQATFDKLQRTIDHLTPEYAHQKDFQALRNHFRYLEGRFDIRTGQYDKGIKNILEMIDVAKRLNQTELLLEGYRQIIHYCIQVENLAEMKLYTEIALDAAITANNYETIAINLRLKGLYHLMIGQFDEARRLMKQAINCFSLTPELRTKYAIQIAAALDYLAEIEQINGQFSQAIALQEEAISVTKDLNKEAVHHVFHIGLGISHYLQGDIAQAEHILLQVAENTKTQAYPWKAVPLDIYLALIQCQKQDYQLALRLIQQKEQLMSRYSNPRDKGLLYYLMTLLRYQIEQGQHTDAELKQLLDQPFSRYYEVAKNHLNPHRDAHLLRELDALLSKK